MQSEYPRKCKTKKQVERYLLEWYEEQGAGDVTLHIERDGDGWKFWRLDPDGDSEENTSYIDAQGFILCYGSREPDPDYDDDMEEEG